MITFHPAARKTSNGYLPMVTLRKDKGQMVGSKLSQLGNAFATAAEAKAFALTAALRVAALYPDSMTVARFDYEKDMCSQLRRAAPPSANASPATHAAYDRRINAALLVNV